MRAVGNALVALSCPTGDSAATPVRARDHVARERVRLQALTLERLDADDRDVGMRAANTVKLRLDLEVQIGVDDDGDAGLQLSVRERCENGGDDAPPSLDIRGMKGVADDAGVEMCGSETTGKLTGERRARRRVTGCEDEDHVVFRADRVDPVATNAVPVQHLKDVRRTGSGMGVAAVALW